MTINYRVLIIIIFLMSFHHVFSQNFSGRIIDNESNPVIGSTVLIKELNQGLVCDNDGRFQTTLQAGRYTIEYRCIGYEAQQESITIEKEKIVREIVLKDKAIALHEVVVSKGEDPAYKIMRQAIQKAPYYQNRVKEYVAESYIKGNMELTNVSKLMDKISSVEGIKMSDIKGNHFVQESLNTITFTAPDHYTQKVEAFTSSIPDDFDAKDAIALSTSSLYLPRFSGMISPLNPKAFSYYHFRYEGYTEEGAQVINKIKIMPKLRDPELMTGYIYVADNTWDIRHAELTSNMYGVEQNFTINYQQLQDDVYLPITFSNRVSVSILGNEAFFNHYTSTKYLKIELNEDPAIALKPDTEKKKSLEVKRNDKYVVETDTLAMHRDSAYWEQIRNLPLSEVELRSYMTKDSIQQHVDSVRKKYTNSSFEWDDLLTGGKLGGDSTKFELKYGGIIGGWRDYNFVDGFGLGQKIELSFKLNETKRLAIAPEVYYTTARKKINWKTDLTLDYAPLRFGRFEVSVGDTSSDFNVDGANKLDNAIS